MKPDNSAPNGSSISGSEATFSRQVSTIIDKFEREFRSREHFIAEFEGEAALETRRTEFEREIRLMRVHLLESRSSIDYDKGEELKEMIANKMAVSSPNRIHSSDWWWTPADPLFDDVLKKVQRVLEKETASKSGAWHQGLSYTWSVLSELIYLAIIVGVFSVASSEFETVVFSALVMIYNSVSSRISSVGLATFYILQRLEEAYSEIGRAIGLRVSVYPAREAAKQISKSGVAVLIHNVSIGIGSLIALWHLVAAIIR